MSAARAASPDRSHAAVAALYDAALDASLWPDALRILTELTASQASSFWVLDSTAESCLPTFVTINFDKSMVDEYLAGMARLDPTVRYLLAHPGESIVHDGMLGHYHDEQTRCYLDWHERKIETRFRMVGQCDMGCGLQAGIALHRVSGTGRYSAEEIERFAMLREHLRRALAIGARLGSLTSLRQLGADVLDRSSAAILLLDTRGRVVFCNRATEQLKSCRDGVQISSDGIRLAGKAEDDRLQSLIRRALASRQQAAAGACGVMSASRPSGRQAYGVSVTAIRQPPIALALFRPAVCVLISDPLRRQAPSVQSLQALFRMTLAEAHLAASLVDGEPLRRAAERLGITYGTARTRLTQIFQKTNTRSQSQLVRLLLTVLAWH